MSCNRVNWIGSTHSEVFFKPGVVKLDVLDELVIVGGIYVHGGFMCFAQGVADLLLQFYSEKQTRLHRSFVLI